MNSSSVLLISLAAVALGVAGLIFWFRASPRARTLPTEAAGGTVRQKSAAAGERDSDFPPKPKWKPNLPIDIDRTIQTFAYYTNGKRSFAIFTQGTCVLLPEVTKEPEADALEILMAVYNYHPDFNPQSMDDGNVLVSYSQPAYSVVFTDEVNANRDYIDRNHLDGIVRDEVLLDANRQPVKFDDRGKAGLLGRARMFLDAQDPRVLRIWTP